MSLYTCIFDCGFKIVQTLLLTCEKYSLPFTQLLDIREDSP